MASVICFILALQWGGQTKNWPDSDVIGTFVNFVVFSILFVVIEYFQGERTIILGRLLKKRLGIGLALQTAVDPSDLPSATVLVLYTAVSQTLGGALLISAGQYSFTNILATELPIRALTVDVAKVPMTGVTELRGVLSAAEMPGSINYYMDGLEVSYDVATAAIGILTLVSYGLKWVNLKAGGKKDDVDGAA
ncbi:hypothetical protein BJ878DRAFT_538156 [Calycina marina]|uniref:Uncharacterized protein n=1 Tax=Calycina marina TaxID=1763456 RepID=A0A9P7ZB50_9HELO|nr:hypothetical protein BJ878DRAFT_538156 [Calycina marina]